MRIPRGPATILWLALAGAAALVVGAVACGPGDEAADPRAPGAGEPGARAEEGLVSGEASGGLVTLDPGAEGAAEPVRLTLEPRLEGQRLLVAGRANLPDGAILPYEITHEGEGVAGDPEGVDLTRAGAARVRDGRYEASVDLGGMPAGRLQVWVLFQTRLGQGLAQPSPVIDRFGPGGERLRGPQVIESDDGVRVIELADTLDYGGR